MPFEFNQRKYMKEIFSFIRDNDITIRDFCAKAKISAATLYRARDTECPLDISTIRKIDAAVAKFLREFV